jgi:2-methylcitrate dehydratase
MPESLADRMVDFAHRTRFDDLAERVVDEAKRRLVDTFACAVGALEEPAPRIARQAARRTHCQDGAALFGGGRAAPDWAAFANGVHIRYLDCNDTYLSLEPAHPSDNWAAVMAAGESTGATGRDWIVATAIAYEIQCRLCDAASIRARGWDHVTYGSLSSCLAASKLMGLSRDQMTSALGIAGTTGTALRLTRAGELSMWKGCAFAHAARNGVFAAQLAAGGLTGPSPLFEGEMGFWQQVSGPFEIPGFGGPTAEDWMLPKTSIKFVPAEYHSQSAIAAAFLLRPRIRDLGAIREVEIFTFRTAVEIIAKDPEKWRPRTRETADHSLPYCTVVALLDGQITAEQFSPARLNDPALLDLVARTHVFEDLRLTDLYPDHVANRVRVTLEDGTILEEECLDPPGHDKNPLTDEQLLAKYRGLTVPVIGEESARSLWSRLMSLEVDRAPHEAIGLIAAID